MTDNKFRQFSESLNDSDGHIWLCEFSKVPIEILNEYYNLLSIEEKSRHARFLFEDDRTRFTISHAMMRTVLASYSKLPARLLSFKNNAHGKPVLDSDSSCNIEFNLSHSKSMVACAVTNKSAISVGVDIEDIRNDLDIYSMFKLCLSVSEVEEVINTSSEETQLLKFLEFWTLKEATLKANGTGINTQIYNVSFSFAEPSGELVFRPYVDNLQKGHYEFSQYNTGNNILSLCIIYPTKKEPIKLSIFDTIPLRSTKINPLLLNRFGSYCNT